MRQNETLITYKILETSFSLTPFRNDVTVVFYLGY